VRSLPAFILTRLLAVLAVLLAVTVITFLMLHLLRPEAWAGDPRSTWTQLVDYLEGVFLHWDFGQSWDRQGRPVAEYLNSRIPADVSLLAGGLVVGTVAGLAGGAVCATRPRSFAARVLELLAAFFICAPVYWVGLMLILTFGAGFGVLPVPFFETNVYAGITENPGDWLRSLIVPWLVLGAPLFALVLRMTRASMVDQQSEDFLRTAHAKGLSGRQVARRHALPAASSPVLALVGVNMATLVTNVVLVEHAFSVPGLFQDLTAAMEDGNFPLLQGMTFVTAGLVVLANLLVDVIHASIDPRVRIAR
jgi:peptide/nickel transport system permease protein